VPPRARCRAFLLLICGLAILAPRVHAGRSSPTEYEVKAAFLYNFANFVEWPPESFPDDKSPIVIGVVGEDPFGESLDATIKGKTANGRKITCKRFKRISDVDTCHILFVTSAEKRPLPKGPGILTVGEDKGFTKRGGVINFTLEDNKVRFEISTENAKKAKLKISSKLLKLARTVYD
jgi:hypothetical protein